MTRLSGTTPNATGSTATASTPAVLGGPPAFAGGLAFCRPAAPPLERVVARLAPSYERGLLTNGPLVRQLEAEMGDRLGGVHAVAVSSCTAGLMLVLRVLAPRGAVVLPSFTFSASAHAVTWNGRPTAFAECDPSSFQLDPTDASTRLVGAGAILATHVFGAPCDVEALERLATSAGADLVFDAAHALGARRGSRPVGGLGTAEVFSLSPTKVVVAGEGGIVATTDAALAQEVRIGRDYGNPGDYDTRFVGLNARMSELHAAVAVESLAELDRNLARRRLLADRYRRHLDELPGIRSQHVDPGDVSTYKDFTVAVAEAGFGLDRDEVAAGLRADGIDTRRYFWPPVHRQQSHATAGGVDPLPVTTAVARQVLSLPIYPALTEADVDRVIEALASLHDHAEQVRAALAAHDQ